MKRITVLLADDHEIVREGFRSLLKHEPDLEVVGEARTGREAVRLTSRLNPAVVVMDIAMPLLNGLEATRQIHRDHPGTKVLILSAHSDEAYIEQAIALGAAGYLLKQTSSHTLARAIREVEQGNTFFSEHIKQPAPGPSRKAAVRPEQRAAHNRLSSREAEVLQLVAEGKPSKQIAGELGVSYKTVDKHRQHLMVKLNIHDIAGLTRYAVDEGIIENDIPVIIP